MISNCEESGGCPETVIPKLFELTCAGSDVSWATMQPIRCLSSQSKDGLPYAEGQQIWLRDTAEDRQPKSRCQLQREFLCDWQRKGHADEAGL